ncbi:hypothetical protein GCM10017744_080150 [Streptomyces antimycoticus]|uniref:Uncharacterized protein n=1 Tax=Streptomyces antimycoticus TaxID=68175 RepID=A0A4D4JZ79_9ACTN|nr:hypothetical protein [Streptomyces antimycoticus]GDY41234.1 hypothetical protein SANT12839_021160 [Streptomyces antimycoticus]
MPRLRLQTRVKRTVGAKKAAETGLALIDISTGAIEPNLSKSGPGPGSARSSAATTTGLLRIADASCAMANRDHYNRHRQHRSLGQLREYAQIA